MIAQGSESTMSMSQEIPQKIANYFVLKKDFFIKSRNEDIRIIYEFSPKILGRGAYGVVFKARLRMPPHTTRVVKLIAKKFVKNPEFLQSEIEITRKLDHPMIVRLYQTFEDDKNIYLVMDYCEGGELFERLDRRGNFNEKDARQIFTQIIKIIKYLHSEKIAHRDLKPENFMMNSDQNLSMKLIDFGLAYQWKYNMREELSSLNYNKLVGTSYYIAPEVIALDYDERCDIWSAGIILYILTTAAPPFDGDNDRQIMERVKKLQYTFDIPQAKSLSAELKDLIKCILVPAAQRITIDEILVHPWMTKQLSLTSLNINFKQLKVFSNFSKLKALAVTYIATQLPEKDIHHLGLLFQQIDTNSDGYLSIQELQFALSKQQQQTISVELKGILDHIDLDRNGKINYNEFIACCLQTSYLQNEQYLSYIFKQLDFDKSGKISKDEIKQVYMKTGIMTSTEIIEQVMKDCDRNGDGSISYLQFLEEMGVKK